MGVRTIRDPHRSVCYALFMVDRPPPTERLTRFAWLLQKIEAIRSFAVWPLSCDTRAKQ